MNYVVLYHEPREIMAGSVYNDTPPVRMETFTDEQEAIDFAKKNDGVILIPAEIKSEVVEPRQGKTLEQSLSHANAKYVRKGNKSYGASA